METSLQNKPLYHPNNAPQRFIYLFEENNCSIDVCLAEGTAWLSVPQIAQLLETTTVVVEEHLRRFYRNGVFDKQIAVRKFRGVRREGERDVVRVTNYHSLDVVLAIGSVIGSLRGEGFRMWVNETVSQVNM